MADPGTARRSRTSAESNLAICCACFATGSPTGISSFLPDGRGQILAISYRELPYRGRLTCARCDLRTGHAGALVSVRRAGGGGRPRSPPTKTHGIGVVRPSGLADRAPAVGVPYQSVRSRSTDFGQRGFEPGQAPTALKPACYLGFEFRTKSAKSGGLERIGPRRAIFRRLRVRASQTCLPRKPQETCHSARRPVWRRARLVWELAEEVRLGTGGLQAGALESGARLGRRLPRDPPAHPAA